MSTPRFVARALVLSFLTVDLVLGGSYPTRNGYVVNFWDDQVLASLVFARTLKSPTGRPTTASA